jgi:serine/threonine protein kinase
MKECPRCFRCWDDDVERCRDDDGLVEIVFAGPPILDRKYRIDRRLGRGGVGVVYGAYHLGLQKTFALKLIVALDQAALARFRIEAATLGRLKHPNIVDVTDFGVDMRGDGLPYLVMEHLHGRTLAEECRAIGPLPLERALPIVDAIAAAIDYAHERGVLHLDLKPSNVFISDDHSGAPAVKILDFGLARFVGEPRHCAATFDGPDAAAASLLRLGLGSQPTSPDRDTGESTPIVGGTASECVEQIEQLRCFGTVAYMAPEILCGHPASPRSDIYSFGTLVYDILVGRPPFQGTAADIVAGHCSEAPPTPSGVNPALSHEFDAPLTMSLEKNVSRRFARAADIARQVRAAATRAQTRTWRQREIPRRIAVATLAAFALPVIFDLAAPSTLLQPFENRLVDARFLSAPKRVPDARLVLVSLDEASLLADPTPLSEKADEFGRQLARVYDAGARAVAIDFLLPEAWSRSRVFSELILRHAEVLTLAAFSSRDGVVIGPECLSALTAAALGPERASDLFAFVNVDEDRDGVYRRARLSFRDQAGRHRDAWAARAVRTFDGDDRHFRHGPATFLIDHSTDWRGFEVIAWKDLEATLQRSPEIFRGRVVLVGGDFGSDVHRVPAGSNVPGLVLQALIANTVLSGFPVHEAAPFPYVVGTSAGVAAVMLSFLLNRRRLVPFLLAAALAATCAAAPFLVFRRAQVLLPVAGPLAMTIIVILLASSLRLVLPAFPEHRADAS